MRKLTDANVRPKSFNERRCWSMNVVNWLSVAMLKRPAHIKAVEYIKAGFEIKNSINILIKKIVNLKF